MPSRMSSLIPTLQDVIDSDMCIACGACVAVAVKFKFYCNLSQTKINDSQLGIKIMPNRVFLMYQGVPGGETLEDRLAKEEPMVFSCAEGVQTITPKSFPVSIAGNQAGEPKSITNGSLGLD